MGLQEFIFELGGADQCVVVLCDSVYFVLALVDVVIVPEADLYQSLTTDYTD